MTLCDKIRQAKSGREIAAIIESDLRFESWRDSGSSHRIAKFELEFCERLACVCYDKVFLEQYHRQNEGEKELSSKIGFQLSHWKSSKQESSRWILSRYYRC